MKKIYLNTIISLGESLTQQEFSDFLAQSQLAIDGIEYRYEMFAQDAVRVDSQPPQSFPWDIWSKI